MKRVISWNSRVPSERKDSKSKRPSLLLLLLLLTCSPATKDDEPPPKVEPEAPLVHPPDELLDSTYDWDLPPGFPAPWEPAANPTTPEKVALGRHLFYDFRLSDNETQSCASCHKQGYAFADGRPFGLGSTGELHSRSSMGLTNIGYASSLTWANPLVVELERQALTPMFGETPIELGLKSKEQLSERLAKEARYEELFEAAYPEAKEHYTLSQVTQCIASFQRTFISGRSPYDRWAYDGEEGALSDSAIRGYELFNSEKLECFHCHGGFNFSDHTHFAGKPFFEAPYHNTGLYNLNGVGDYPEPNWGVYAVSLDEKHMGRHKAPTLRNIAVTFPYMHDGSVATLSDVLDHYAAGGRTIEDGPNAGVGSESPLKDSLVRPFEISEEERADLLAFFESLTDEEFLHNEAFSDPW